MVVKKQIKIIEKSDSVEKSVEKFPVGIEKMNTT